MLVCMRPVTSASPSWPGAVSVALAFALGVGQADTLAPGSSQQAWTPYAQYTVPQAGNDWRRLAGEKEQTFHGQPSQLTERPGRRELTFDVERAAEAIRSDTANPAGRDRGSLALTLADGSTASASVLQGPRGNHRFQVTLPGGRLIRVYADRELAGEALDQAVASVASAYRVVPRAYGAPAYVPPELVDEFESWRGQTLQDGERFRLTHALDGLSEVFLFPSLGIAQEGEQRSVRASQTLPGGGLAVRLARAQDMWNQMSTSSSQGTRWRRVESAGRDSAERMTFDHHSLGERWPSNTAIVTASRQGEYLPTYASWLDRGLERLPEARSLPDALAGLNGQALIDYDDSGLPITYHPVTSTNLGPGWVRGEERPRVALLVTGYLPADGSPNTFNAARQVERLRQSLEQNYPGIQIRQVDQARPEDVELALQSMATFARENKGAESLVFTIAHGHNSGVDPGRSDDRLNGSVEGHLALRDRTLSETTLKQWTRQYLGGYSNNLMLFYACDSGAFAA